MAGDGEDNIREIISPLDQRSPRRITLPSAATGQHSSCPKNIVPQSRGGIAQIEIAREGRNDEGRDEIPPFHRGQCPHLS